MPPREPPRLEAPARPWELGVGASVSLSIGGLSPGANAFGSLTAGRTGWGGDLGVAALGSHDFAVGGGIITWQRFALGVGPHYRVFAEPVTVDVSLRGLAALLHIHTADFLPARTNQTDFGALAAVRAEPQLGPIRLWIELSGAVWPVRPQLQLITQTRAVPLSTIELVLSEGFAFGAP